MEHGNIWLPLISDVKFAVCDMGQLCDLIKAFNRILEEDPHARGDPALFK